MPPTPTIGTARSEAGRDRWARRIRTAGSFIPSSGCFERFGSLPTMNEFQWLLIPGFPPEIAAATVMPAVFIAGEAS